MPQCGPHPAFNPTQRWAPRVPRITAEKGQPGLKPRTSGLLPPHVWHQHGDGRRERGTLRASAGGQDGAAASPQTPGAVTAARALLRRDGDRPGHLLPPPPPAGLRHLPAPSLRVAPRRATPPPAPLFAGAGGRSLRSAPRSARPSVRAPARPWPAGRGAGAVPAFHHGGAVCWRSAAPRLRRGQRRRARSVPPRRDSGSAPEGSPRSAGPAVGRGRRGRDGGERRSPPWARWAVPGPAAARGGQGAARGGGRCPSVHPSVCLSVSVW